MINLHQNTLLREIPDNLLRDEKVKHLANSLQSSLDNMLEWADKINYRMNLEALPDEIIEHLLWESHITVNEGLELATTREQKINLIKHSVELHRLKGTPAALEMVFQLINIDCRMQEWFEYGGDPYHFKLDVMLRDKSLNEENLKLLTSLVMEYKNVRSWLDAIHVHLASVGPTYVGACAIFGEEITVFPWQVTNIESNSIYYVGSAQQTFDTTTIYPKREV